MSDIIREEEADDKFVEDTVKHLLMVLAEYEFNKGYSFCFCSQIQTTDGRVLTLDVRPKEEWEAQGVDLG